MVLLGKKIKDLRNTYRLTQTELAFKVGVTKSTIAAYENNSRTPSFDILIKLARVFHVTTDSLLADASETVIRARNLTDEQIIILDTMIESFQAANLLKGAVDSEAAIADVIEKYREISAGKIRGGRKVGRKDGEKRIDKSLEL